VLKGERVMALPMMRVDTEEHDAEPGNGIGGRMEYLSHRHAPCMYRIFGSGHAAVAQGIGLQLGGKQICFTPFGPTQHCAFFHDMGQFANS